MPRQEGTKSGTGICHVMLGMKNEYARKDWAVRDMTTSIAKAYLRHLFPKLNFNY